MIGLMKDESDGQIMTKPVGWRAKTYSYLKHNNNEDKQKSKRGKKLCHQKNPKFRDYKNCLKASQIENKINYLEKKKNYTGCLKDDKK